MSRLPGVPDRVLARANLTDRQLQALQLYSGRAGYRSVGRALDISRDGARALIQAGLYKLRLASEAEPVSVTFGPAAKQRRD